MTSHDIDNTDATNLKDAHEYTENTTALELWITLIEKF